MSGCGLPCSTSSPVITASKNAVSPCRARNGRADALRELVATARCRFICRSSCRTGLVEGNRVGKEVDRDLPPPLHHFVAGHREAKRLLVKLDGEPVTHSQHVSVVFVAISND